MTSIPLHPEHGLNPTMPICIWCEKPKGEIALLGNGYKGEAPLEMILDYEPCEECQKTWDQGIVLIEVLEKPLHPSQPPIPHTSFYPTGRHIVVKREWCVNITPDSLRENVLQCGRCFIGTDTFNAIVESFKAANPPPTQFLSEGEEERTVTEETKP